jgi:hypothetical protein
MHPWLRRSVLVAVLTGAGFTGLALSPATEEVALAKSSFDSSYGYANTWNAALRMIRVDRGFKLTEKDEAGGYLLFEYTSSESGKKGTPGSIEILHGAKEDSPVKVVINLPQMPSYHEQVLANDLQKKLRADFGESVQTPKKVLKDAGTDAESPQ